MKVVTTIGGLKEISDIIGSITNEAKFEFESDGLHIRAIDSARIAMVDLFVSSKNFTSYDVPEKTDLPMDMEKLRSVIRLGGSSDEVTLIPGSGKIKFSMGNLSKSIALLEYGNINPPKLPSVNPENFVVIPKSQFDRGLKAAADVRDSVRFILAPDSFTISSKSDSEDAELRIDSTQYLEIKSSGEVKSSYPSDYLIKILKSVGTAENLRISFNNDYPLVIELEFPQTAGEKKVKFLLAPRME